MPETPGPRRWRALALLLLGPGVGAASVAGSIASVTGVAETEAAGLNNASFQIGGAIGTAILSTAAIGGLGALVPLGRRREPATQAEPATA